MKKEDNNRRSFLKQIAAGSAMVTGSVLIGKKATAQEAMKDTRPAEVLYQKTDAFQKYYDSLR